MFQVELDKCNFLVDSQLPGSPATVLEPNYISNTDKWETMKCVPFLDASQTHIISRMLWIPELPFIPPRYRRKWGSYCLLRRKQNT